MKTFANKRTLAKSLGLAQWPEANQLLQHLLSPMELAAFEHDFNAFSYNLDGEQLAIESKAGFQLYLNAQQNVQLGSQIVRQARQKAFMQDDAVRHFLTKPLSQHNLPTRLYHILSSYNCRSMQDVIAKDLHELMQMRGLGQWYFDILRERFKDNGCGNLFL